MSLSVNECETSKDSNDEFVTALSDNDETYRDIVSLDTSCNEDLFQDIESDTIVEECSSDERIKFALIVDCLLRNDVKSLRSLGKERAGFVCDRLRRMVWPKICKVDVIASSPRPDTQKMEQHPFYTQVTLDVNRSLKRFPPSIAEQHRLAMQQQLVNLIMRVLMQNPSFHYYQGYHDICITFLLVLGEETAFHVVNAISKSHLHLFMEKTMESTAHLLEVIPIIIKQENERLADFLEASGVGNIFCLSWVITWFSHVLKNYQTVGRLFDLFLVSDEYMSIYLTSSIILFKSNEIMKLNCDLATVHHYLSRTVESEESIPFEELIIEAQHLLMKYPSQYFVENHLKTKKEEQSLQKFSVFRPLMNVKNLFRKASSFGFISLAFFVVISASLFQFLRSKY
ncbi:TBC1 domain family member 20-like protein [Leptotrombidium deliense]|uniref:TBC1 domain family member 20-like protein n=1 Tax=Leptotrombidium deliense TaxID=299467 RepID=A0A443SRG7_9ACAR|nr:TBC1 domain family member 20-like protein [Leptotrombidium deliense]